MRSTLSSLKARVFFGLWLAPAILASPARGQTIDWIRQFGSEIGDQATGVQILRRALEEPLPRSHQPDDVEMIEGSRQR